MNTKIKNITAARLALPLLVGMFFLVTFLLSPALHAATKEPITLTMRDLPVAEAFHMLAKKERVNIVLGKDISGNVSVNLYNVSLDEAIEAVADSAGCRIEKRAIGYFIRKDDTKNIAEIVPTITRSFKIHYAAPADIEASIKDHLSSHGSITNLEERQYLVITDTEESLQRIEKILYELDRQPKQILIETKILEITLNDTEIYGIDWTKTFTFGGAEGVASSLGGIVNETATGGFVAAVQGSSKIDFVLNALRENNRTRSLASPKLLTLENQEASVIVGDRQGFRVTTTINQVTSESVEFLESGVILRVKASVTKEGKILMSIQPEISSGRFELGIPSQTTTSVSTELLAEDGQPIFIGGLIKRQTKLTKNGVPILGAIPVLGYLFSSTEDEVINTETVILIIPSIVEGNDNSLYIDDVNKVQDTVIQGNVENEW